MRRGAAGLVGLIVAAHAAKADPPAPLAVAWRAPPECPDEQEFAQRVEAGVPEPGRAVIRVTAARAESRWVARVDAGGEVRILVGTSCDEVASAAALVVAMLRPARAASSVAPQPDPLPVDDAELPPPDRVAAGCTTCAGSDTMHLTATAAVGAQIGALPGVAPVASLALGADTRRFGVEVELAYSAVAGAPIVDMNTGQVDAYYRALTAELGLCWQVTAFSVCGGPEAGRITASADNQLDHDEGAGTWVAVAAGPRAQVRLGRAAALVLQAELAIPLVYPDFSLNGAPLPGPAHAVIRSSGGIRVAFW